MDVETSRSEAESLEQAYKSLIDLWTAGVRDYNSLLSDYLTANSIFVAAIGFLLGPTAQHTSLCVSCCHFMQFRHFNGASNGHRPWPLFRSDGLMGMEAPGHRTKPKLDAAGALC